MSAEEGFQLPKLGPYREPPARRPRHFARVSTGGPSTERKVVASVREWIAPLTEKQRPYGISEAQWFALVQHVPEGRSIKQIARMQGVHPSTVLVRVNVAAAKLQTARSRRKGRR